MVMPWQGRSSVALASAANVLLVTAASLCLWRPSTLFGTTNNHLLLARILGGVLLSQAVTVTLLLVPLWQDVLRQLAASSSVMMVRDTSIHLLQAGAVGLSGTGLTLTLAMVIEATSSSSSSSSSSLSVQTIVILVGAIALLLLACASLMISFWSTLEDDHQIADDEREEEQQRQQEEVEPLLSSSQSPANDEEEGSAPIQTADSNSTEGINGYRLLRDEEEDSTPSQEEEAEHPTTTTTTTTTGRLRGTRRLLQLAAPQVLYLYAGCAVLLLRLPFSLSIPHFVSTTLSALAVADFGRAKMEILLLVLAGSIDAALDFWCVFLFGYANQRIVRGVRLDLFRKLIRQEIAFFDRTTSGELSSRLQSDCSEMAGDLTWFFRFSIESVVRITGITTYMLIRSPILGACALSIAPIVAVVNKLYGNWLAKNQIQVQNALAEANAVAQEALANIRTVIAFAAERQESERYETKIQRQYTLNVRQLYMTGVYYMAISTFLINTIVQAMILYIGSKLIQNNKLTAEVLLAFMLYQGQLQNETLNLFQSYSSLIKSSGAGDKVFALLDRKPPPPSINSTSVRADEDRDTDNHEADGEISHKTSNQYNVQLQQVSFSYPSRPHHTVLDKIDLDIPKGNTVALVGSSGCGKSTIVNLLQRFYDPVAGSIRIDGQNLRQLDLLEHRRHIGIVTQDPVLFRGTVMENILYGRPDATREEAIQAARRAHADDFIRSFPQGYETGVGERGVQLSGGQLQRIAIARALVKNPSLLILDEATSMLDNHSEHMVQRALDELLVQPDHHMTTVVVAHRLRTVQKADCIAVLQQGRIIEQGTHEELLQQAGVYRKMVERADVSGMLPEK